MLGDLLSFAGGLIGQSQQNKQSSLNRALTREQMQMQRHQFNEQMDASIQRRVSDAQKAGVHPLFALGASAGASPTVSIGGQQQPTGSALGDALRGIGGRIAQAELNSRSAAAKRDEAEAAYHNARTKLLEQDFASRGRDGVQSSVQTFPYPGGPQTDHIRWGPADYVRPERKQMVRPGVEGGVLAEKVRVQFEDGHEMLMPSEDVAEEIREWEYMIKRGLHHLSHKPPISVRNSKGEIIWQWPKKWKNPK